MAGETPAARFPDIFVEGASLLDEDGVIVVVLRHDFGSVTVQVFFGPFGRVEIEHPSQL